MRHPNEEKLRRSLRIAAGAAWALFVLSAVVFFVGMFLAVVAGVVTGSVPACIAVSVATIGVFVGLVRLAAFLWARADRRIDEAGVIRCGWCGYNRAGLGKDTECPECGHRPLA